MDDIEEGWEVYYDNGEPYFFNASTGETTWDKPIRKKVHANDPPQPPKKDSGGKLDPPLRPSSFLLILSIFPSFTRDGWSARTD
jgi:hypothetical protein